MNDYKETRDIVSTEENRQLQTVISAEVLSSRSKNHLYKIKLKNKKYIQKKQTAFIFEKRKSKTNENNKTIYK